ncbi:MAG: alginate export family protein [Proteobacteria bacterium]|nr:alginate export family protein [Pseudomonadota bacterium]
MTRDSTRVLSRLLLGLATAWLGFPAATAVAEEETPGWLVPLIGGKVHLDARARLEIADFDTLEQSEAATIRTRLGYETGAWQGISGFVEMENIAALSDDAYFDGVASPNGKSIIADPEGTELNRVFLKVEREEFDTRFVGGRQRVKLDDDRFIGNVGWRQNEQTLDAVRLDTSLGIDGLSVLYGYVWDVHRIFGDEGPPNRRDFDSDSHMVRVAYTKFSFAKPVLFGYFFDFDNSVGNSANSFGVRVTGDVAPLEKWKFSYQLSYARQVDAADNPVDYEANYYLIDGKLGYAPLGAIGIGYEELGSDDGIAVFTTPLATAHKFNGYADVFLNNGGPRGLRDLYVYVAPKLPFGLKGKLAYHRFESDQGDNDLGDEIDAVLSRGFTKHVNVLAKYAYYDSSGNAPLDRWRFWLQTELKF